MAVNLNKPSDFHKQCNANSTGGSNVIQLLPPSSFEAGNTGIVNPLRELASATSEILTLKQQNQQLRECKQVSIAAGEEIKARVDLHQSPQTLLQSKHLDEIINRQAAEIAQLRERLQSTEGQYQRQVARLESQIVVRDAECKQQVAVLQQEVQRLAVQHEEELNFQKSISEREATEKSNKIRHLETEIDVSGVTKKQMVDELEDNLRSLQEEYKQYKQESQHHMREAEQNIENYRSQLEQHKKYISETEQTAKSTHVWKKQMDTLQNKIHVLEAEKDNLESSLQLVNIRLKSQNDMHVIQEQQLAQVKDNSNEKKKAVLLTRWREKVFELLVQLESASITQKNTERNYEHKIQGLECELESEKNSCELLKHTLTNKQAQLDIEKHNVQTLQAEITSAQQLAIQLDDRNKEYQLTIRELVDFANGVYEKYCESEKSLTEVKGKLTAYNKRISFASGRVEMLQSQFARKEALLRVEIEDKYQEKPTKDIEVPNEYSIVQLNEELERVQKERDHLAAQIKQDAITLEERISNAKQLVADEVNQLRLRTTELHQQLENKNLKMESLQESLESSQNENSDYRETLEQLGVEMGKLQVQHEKDKENVKSEVQSEVTEQLAEMEHRLNEARREHTKAVVQLCQTERQGEREKEKKNEEIKRLEDYYKQHIVKLEHNVRSLESDRNLLMTTLRQEGLVGKHKAQRGSPVQLHDTQETDNGQETDLHTQDMDLSTGMTEDLDIGITLEGTRDTYFEDTDDLQQIHANEGASNDVLEELKKLSEDVLQDSDENSN